MADLKAGSTAGGELLLTTSSVKRVTRARELQKIQSSDVQTGDGFGRSPVISKDGSICLIGAASEDTGGVNAGAVYVFKNQSGTWVETQKIQSNDIQADDLFGASIAISSDGLTCVIGAYYEDGNNFNNGAAYIFENQSGIWTQVQKLQATDADSDDEFGYSVDMSADGSVCVIGARGEDGTGSSMGAAYIFENQGGTWVETQKLQATDKEDNDFFGHSVSITDDGLTCVIGAYLEDSTAFNSGAVYIFENQGGTWVEIQKIQSNDAQSNDEFGEKVKISKNGSTIIVGAANEDQGFSDTGAVYIFSKQENTWNQADKLVALDAQANDLFGINVSISDDGLTALIGAHREDTGGNSAGAAYLFTFNGEKWLQQQKIIASDAQSSDLFGEELVLSPDGLTCFISTLESNASYIYEIVNKGY